MFRFGDISISGFTNQLRAKDAKLTIFAVDIFKKGYPNLAAFKNSDKDFAVYCRFGYLQSRILLERQDQLRVSKERLDKMDKSDMYRYTRSLDAEYLMPRQALLQEIEETFRSYGAVRAKKQYELAKLTLPSEYIGDLSKLAFMQSSGFIGAQQREKLN